MANLTRILNNQIYNSTIVGYQKIAPYTITGQLFGNSLTIGTDLTITGNLTVTGNSQISTIASTNTFINDPLILINNAFTGTNSYDLGFVFNRGSAINQAFIWNEANKEFRLLATTETGSTFGAINQSSFANLHVGNLTVDYTTTVGAITAPSLNVSGNVLASTVSGSFLTASTVAVGNISAVTIGNVGTQFNGSAINLSGNVLAATVYAGLLTANNLTVGNVASGFIGNTGTAFTGASINLTGNVLTSTVGASYVTASTMTVGNISAVNFGNASAVFTGASINLSGNVLAAGAIYNALTVNGIGNVSAINVSNINVGAGGFNSNATVNAANFNTPGNVLAQNGVYNALTVNGNETVTGYINVAGNVLASSLLSTYTSATSAVFGNVASGFIGNTGTAFTGASINLTGNILSTGAVYNALTVNGPVGISGNIIAGLAQFAAINSTPIGNITASTGAFTTLSAANSLWANASIATSTQGTGAIVVPNGGISVAGAANIALTTTIGGATQINNTLGVGGAVSLTLGTNSTGVQSGGTFTVTGGAAFSQDVWIGGNLYVANIIGQQTTILSVVDPLLYLNASNAYPYTYDIGVYSHFIGNGLSTLSNIYQHTGMVRDYHNNTWTFFSNVAEPSSGIVTFDSNTVYDPIKAGNLALVNGNPATNSQSGALQVLGGAGITGNLYVGAGIQGTVIGNVTAAAGTFTTVTAGAVSAPFIGNSGAILAATTTNSSTVNAGAINAVTFGNTGSTASFNTVSAGAVSAVTFGNTGATANFNTVNAGAVSAVTLGNTGTTANVDTINAGAINGVTFGNTGATANFNTVNAGAINAVTIGNTSAIFSGASINLSGNVLASSILGSYIQASTVAVGNISAVTIGNASSILNGATFNATGNVLASSMLSSYIQSSTVAVGNIAAVNFGNAGATVTASTINAGNIFVGTTGNITVNNTAISTSSTTGAVVIKGGVGLGANLNVQNGATFNFGQLNYANAAVTIRGASDPALFVATPGANGLDGVVIGGFGNATPQGGVPLKVGGTGAMMIPTGSSGQTPGLTGNVDVVGMIRYDTGLGSLTYFNGSVWASIGGAFTVIQDAQFNGDGANVAFVLSNFANANVSTNGSIVSINGVMQLPGAAYSIGYGGGQSTVTFTEAPAVGDLIDVRYFTASAVVTAIQNGYASIDVNNPNYANVGVGNTISLNTQSISVDADSHINIVNGSKLTYNQTDINIPALNTPVQVDTFYQTAYSTSKYVVQVKNNNGTPGNIETQEALVITDNQGNAYITVYGTINSGYTMGTLSVNVVNGNVTLWYTSTTSAGVNANVKVYSNYIV